MMSVVVEGVVHITSFPVSEFPKGESDVVFVSISRLILSYLPVHTYIYTTSIQPSARATRISTATSPIAQPPLTSPAPSEMAYVAVVKALYDYVAQDPDGELSFSEDQIIYVVDKEDDECVLMLLVSR
jgi:hypothetical protein